MNNYDVLIKAASDFYNGRVPEISDKKYDELLAQAKAEDPNFNIFDHFQFECEAGSRKIHPIAYKNPEFKDMFESYSDFQKSSDERANQIRLLKWDGSSVSAYYNNGKLTCILSRRDEYEGIDQTEKLKSKVPSEVDPQVIKIDFESLTSTQDFGDGCRAKANGLINSKYLADEVEKYLHLEPFYVQTIDNSIPFLERFKLAGLDNYPTLFEEDNFDSETCTYKHPNGNTYPVDGFVYRYNDEDRFYIWKFYYISSKIATIDHIEWNLADTGAFIPKIILDPIVIDGTNVMRVASGSLANMRDNHRCVGAKVRVIRSGSTIPKIIETVSYPEVEEYNYPKCSECGSDTFELNGQIRCSNPECNFFKDYIVDNIEDYLKKYPYINLYNIIKICIGGLGLPRFGENHKESATRFLLNRYSDYGNLDNIEYIEGVSWNSSNVIKHFIPLITNIINKYKFT